MAIRKLLTVALAAALAGLAAADAPDAVARQEKKDDKALLEGTWVVVTAEEVGAAQAELDKAKFVFKGDKVTIKLKDEKDTTELTFKIDAAKTPKTIDLAPAGGAPVGEGVYELAGDSLKICMAEVGVAKRPAALAAKDKGVTLVVLKREK